MVQILAQPPSICEDLGKFIIFSEPLLPLQNSGVPALQLCVMNHPKLRGKNNKHVHMLTALWERNLVLAQGDCCL